MEDEVAQVARGSAYLLAMNLAMDIISVMAFMFMVNFLAVEEIGIYTVMWMVINIANLLPSLISAIVKFISQTVGAGEDPRPVLTSVLLGRALMGSAIGLSCAALSAQLSLFLLRTPDYAFVFQLLGIDIIFRILRGSLSSCLLGLNRPRDVSITGTVGELVRQALVISFLWMGYGLYGLLLAWLLGDALACVYPLAVLVSMRAIVRVPLGEAKRILSGIIKFSIPIFITNLVGFARGWFDKIIVLSSGNLGGLGVYNVALTAYNLLMAIPSSIGMAVSPYYGEKFGGGKHEDTRSMTRLASKYLSLLFIPASLGLAALSRMALGLLGEAYEQNYEILMLVAVLGVYNVVPPLLTRYLIVYEKMCSYTVARVSSIAAGIGLALALMPDLGLLGVALAKSLSGLLLAVFCVLATWGEVGPDWRSIAKCLTAGSIMAVIVYVVQALTANIFLIPAYVLLGASIYVLAIRMLGVLSPEDIRSLTAILPKKVRKASLKLGLLILTKKK